MEPDLLPPEPPPRPVVVPDLRAWLRGPLVALLFFTRVPTPRLARVGPAELVTMIPWFPIIGATIGLTIGGLGEALQLMPWHPIGPFAAAILVSAAGVLVTGGLHEDGLADTFDGLGGGRDREKILTILRDSRIGSYGGIALIHALLLRVVTLGSTAPGAWAWGLALAHLGGRLGAVVLMAALPYARPDDPGVSRTIIAGVDRRSVGISLLLAAPVLLAIGPAALGPLVAVGLLSLALGRWYWRRLGGITGDLVGATVILGEVAALTLWAAAHPR